MIYPRRAQLRTILDLFEPTQFGYQLDQVDDYTLVKCEGYERYVDNIGKIWRYDDETDMMVEATAEPLVGSFVTTSDGRTHTYKY